MTTPGPDDVRREEHQVSGEGLVAKIKEIVRQGNVRRIIIKDESGRTLLEIPLTIGVVGVLLAPVWIAVGAIAALAANYTLVVETAGDAS
jgi:hypothetical protein